MLCNQYKSPRRVKLAYSRAKTQPRPVANNLVLNTRRSIILNSCLTSYLECIISTAVVSQVLQGRIEKKKTEVSSRRLHVSCDIMSEGSFTCVHMTVSINYALYDEAF